MKMTVVYYSKSGNTKQAAETIVAGMQSVAGVQAKAFALDAIDADWARQSKCLVLGSPIYMASICSPVKAWLEGPCAQYGLAGKLGGAFATADYVHGGGDLGIRLMLDHMLVYGMLTYSGGGSYGKPVIHLGPVALSGRWDDSSETFRVYGQRMATKAIELFGADV